MIDPRYANDYGIPSQVYVVKIEGDPLLPINYSPWRGNPFGDREIEVIDSGDSRLGREYVILVTQVTAKDEPFPAYLRDKEEPPEFHNKWHAFTGSALRAEGSSTTDPRNRRSLESFVTKAAENGLVHSKKQGLVPLKGHGGVPRITGTIYQEGGAFFGLIFTAGFRHQQIPMFSPQDDPYMAEHLPLVETTKDFRFFTADEILDPDNEQRFTPWSTLYAAHIQQERMLRRLLGTRRNPL